MSIKKDNPIKWAKAYIKQVIKDEKKLQIKMFNLPNDLGNEN